MRLKVNPTSTVTPNVVVLKSLQLLAFLTEKTIEISKKMCCFTVWRWHKAKLTTRMSGNHH